VFQRRDIRRAARFNSFSDRTIEDRVFPAFAIGVDVPARFGRHVVVTPLARVYVLRRDVGEYIGVGPSERLMAGVTAGVEW
jgi:hypothetical protein